MKKLTMIYPKMAARLAKQCVERERVERERERRREQNRLVRERIAQEKAGLPVDYLGEVWWVSRETLDLICARVDGLRPALLLSRLQRSWSLEEALEPDAYSRRRKASARTNGRYLTYQGRTQLMTDWAKEIGVARITIRERLKCGWSVERALATPTRPMTRGPERERWMREFGAGAA